MREALRNPTEVLKNLMEKSKNETYRFQRLYRNLYNSEFYWFAFKNIYANDGSMTAGADGTTIDGMSNERIEKIIKSLKDRSYQPKPARREYIAKKNSDKKRPLGIQSGNDKLVQEVVKKTFMNLYLAINHMGSGQTGAVRQHSCRYRKPSQGLTGLLKATFMHVSTVSTTI